MSTSVITAEASFLIQASSTKFAKPSCNRKIFLKEGNFYGLLFLAASARDLIYPAEL